MGTQGTGRKRNPNKERSTAEDDALNLIAREAEARLAAKRAARAEAREIRMKELERQQKEEDNERYSRPSRKHTSISDDDECMSVGSRSSVRSEDRDYLEKGSRAASVLSAATLASLGGTSSRRGSVENSISAADTEVSIREIKEIHELKDQIQDVESKYMQNLKQVKDSLVEVEEKYRKAMVSNAQLDNEKNNLMYQVDTLKDSLMELEELLSESRREYEEKLKEHEREKHAHTVLQFQFNELKETLKQSEEMLTKHGIVLGPDLTTNGESVEAAGEGSQGGDPASRLAQDPHTPSEGNSVLEIRLRKLVDERENLIGQVKKLKAQVEQRRPRTGPEDGSTPDGDVQENGTDGNLLELQRDATRQVSDLKFKLAKVEQEVTASEQNVTRLEGQVIRYKSASENSEKMEDELKAEKRKLQRELRTALDKVDELESNNSHLNKRLDKMKANRTTATTP